ncbi:MAG TPA: DUF5985 family protein [Tepidisphaeraceae bacterium]|jgi:hypothetical protein|nr:DUF5985 family protein [Tepidisphaeraceae bacterium]
MGEAVYILCALTSIACAIMLARGYMRSRARLLLWSSLCFVGFAANNAMLYIDKVLLPTQVDLSIWRTLAALVGLLILLYGLIWDAE